MKTAEEWANELNRCDLLPTALHRHTLRMTVIKQIRTETLREAAEICVNEEELQPLNQAERNTMDACRCAILDKAKELELRR